MVRIRSGKDSGDAAQFRFRRLYEFLKSGKLQVKVLPSERFGLVHGKAGVITIADGTRTAFLGSINETYAAWKLNYELLWEDSSEDAVTWVQEEFDALWNGPHAVTLAEFVIEDVGRIARRTVIPEISAWREDPKPEETIVETPGYRREFGLWEHQKYFVNLASKPIADRTAHASSWPIWWGLGRRYSWLFRPC